LEGLLAGTKHSFNSMKGNVIITAGNAKAFERSLDMLDSSMKELQRVAQDMMPETLVRYGLDAAVKDLCSDITHSGVLRVNYQSIGLEDAEIEQIVAITIYRIIEELLNNIIKHADVKTALVQVSKTNKRISITVEDNGKGFNTAVIRGAKGIGWYNIESWVEFLKGKVDIQSGPGKGTSVLIEFKNP